MEKGGNYEWDSLSARPLCVMSTHYKTQFKGPGLYDTIGKHCATIELCPISETIYSLFTRNHSYITENAVLWHVTAKNCSDWIASQTTVRLAKLKLHNLSSFCSTVYEVGLRNKQELKTLKRIL